MLGCLRNPPAWCGLVALLVGCSGGPPDIVLISIDSLRADRLGCYGASGDTSPALDRLASEGLLFTDAVAPTSWTLPSHATLLTGASIAAHRVRTAHDRLDPERTTLAEHLAGQGYRTAGFVSAPFLHPSYRLDQGIDHYRNFAEVLAAEDELPGRDDHERSHRLRSAGQVVDAAIAWLEGLEPAPGGPVFLFVHLWDPHYDYDPPEAYRERFVGGYEGALDPAGYIGHPGIHAEMPAADLRFVSDLYDAEIRWTDDQVARLLGAVEATLGGEDTLVSVVSDHGEEFFEHGRRGHSRTLFEESVRVPWLLRYPPRVRAGVRVAGAVGLEDVAPTLLELAELPPLPEATGVGRVAAFSRGETSGRPVLLELGEKAALRGSGWKVVRSPKGGVAYYDLRGDPGEQEPKLALRAAPERVQQLEARLEEDRARAESWLWQEVAPVPDLETRESLEALGYLVDDGSGS